MRGGKCRKQTCNGLDSRVTWRNRSSTRGTPATQDHPAHNRYVLQRGNLMSALWATGSWFYERKWFLFRGLLAAQFRALVMPLPLHHSGESVNNHVEEAANEQSKGTAKEREQSGR